MADKAKEDEKESKRRKQVKKMTKILAQAWDMPNGEPFQECDKISTVEDVFDLASLGQNLDEGVYQLGRSGWEKFARDIGGVYNRHIQRKTKFASVAKAHRSEVCSMLGKINDSLVKQAIEHFPRAGDTKKRKPDSLDDANRRPSKKTDTKNGGDMTLAEREAKAMRDLENYILESGGNCSQIKAFNSRVTRKSDGRYDTNFFFESRRFRSMIEVARFLNLVSHKDQPNTKVVSGKTRPLSSRDAVAEKRKLRKELEKYSKIHEKATKALDDFRNDQLEKQYPMDDEVLVEELKSKSSEVSIITATTCPAARIPDLEGFPDVPDYCIPDLLMVWDFLCTFSRALSLQPIQVDDFVAALTFKPHETDPLPQPPVYLAEAHLALLKLLLGDQSSDDWWWSILDTDDSNEREDDGVSATIDPMMPVIKIDFAELLAVDEDPLLTSSWLQALEEIRNIHFTKGRHIKQCIKSAASIAANRWVKSYLKKALTDWKPDFAMFTKRAAIWLVDRVKEARPDLYGKKANTKSFTQQRTATIDRIAILMEKLDDSGDVVAVDDVDSDDDEESDEDSDEEEGDSSQGRSELGKSDVDESETPVKTALPEKPFPTIIDLLLPPSKPHPSSDLVNSFSWPQLTGASVCRILHSYKHLRNLVDDKLRDSKGLPPMSVGERRIRETEASSRVSTESTSLLDSIFPAERAASLLSDGASYLDLSTVEKLCILRILVDSAYDSTRVYEVVDSNYKQRHSAVKALEAEERRAKREAREEAAAADQAAREALAAEARDRFLDEKRNELRKLNQQTNEYSYAVIDELTEEDIIDFDEDSKAEYAALPTPQSFNKTEVNAMVKKLQEQTAFDTHSVTVITIDRIKYRDEEEIRSKKSELKSFESLDVYDLGRDGARKLDRLRREIQAIQESAATLREVRESAMEQLREAIDDGTVKSLKTAIKIAKQAKLCGVDYSTGGVWTIDLLRDAALELKAAERRKRVIEAKKDLVAKMNKCFIRTEPLGRDRFKNYFWHFENDGSSCVWVEAPYILSDKQDIPKPKDGFVNLMKALPSINIGPEEKEMDLFELDVSEETKSSFLMFSRKEFHASGKSNRLVQRHWGGHSTEKALKNLAKDLDERGIRERSLKANLKEVLEQSGLAPILPDDGVVDEDGIDASRIHETVKMKTPLDHEEGDEDDGSPDEKLQTSGDQEVLKEAIKFLTLHSSSIITSELLSGITTGIGSRVRVRMLYDQNKPGLIHYHLGVVVGWRQDDGSDFLEENDLEQTSKSGVCALWKIILDRGRGEIFLTASDLIESICRYKRWKSSDKSYCEHDAAFLSYRNSVGRHCGKAAEAAISASPSYLARLMIKREQELYNPLKALSLDNNWGGKSESRNAWTFSMKDDFINFLGAKHGLLKLEEALFELTGGFPDSMAHTTQDAKSILSDHKSRFDIELESIDPVVKTLWNSRLSREIFLEITNQCSTTGVLALALDLLCRNCWAFINSNTVKQNGRVDKKPMYDMGVTTRATRRLNAWQQANQQDWF